MLKHQLLKYADKPLSGEDLEIDISVCFLWLSLGEIASLCSHEPINCFFAIILGSHGCKPCWLSEILTIDKMCLLSISPHITLGSGRKCSYLHFKMRFKTDQTKDSKINVNICFWYHSFMF